MLENCLGVEWRVLADYTNSNYALIITENVWALPDRRYNDANEFQLFDNSTVVRGQINTWFEGYVGHRLRNNAVSYRFVDEFGNSIMNRNQPFAGIETDTPAGTSGSWGPANGHLNNGMTWKCTQSMAFMTCGGSDGMNWSRAISRPEPGTNAEPFILSATEVNTFFGANGTHE